MKEFFSSRANLAALVGLGVLLGKHLGLDLKEEDVDKIVDALLFLGMIFLRIGTQKAENAAEKAGVKAESAAEQAAVVAAETVARAR